MKTKFVLTVLLSLYSINVVCQTNDVLLKRRVEQALIEFVYENKELAPSELAEYKSGKKKLHFFGVYNNYDKEQLIDGLYIFYRAPYHAKSYFLLVEGDKYDILDISTQSGLKESISELLDFCERKKYCVDIVQNYTAKLISTYNTTNKPPRSGIDINCQKGIKDFSNLP